jgi:Flp pilus assembly protein protease CpaA
MGGLYEGQSVLNVLFVTGVLGGGAAWLAGRAIAQTWRPFWHLALYMVLLGGAVRFVHFALFEGTLLSPAAYAVDTLWLMMAATLAWRTTRAGQMATQYYWLFERAGPLSWRERARPPAGESTANSG